MTLSGKVPSSFPAVRIHPRDNVVTASRRIAAGEAIGDGVTAETAVPMGHKIAAVAIGAGMPVLKYGQVIGAATRDIARGAHVHVHNMEMCDVRAEIAVNAAPVPTNTAAERHFRGYRRPNGTVGVRNYVGVLTSVNCAGTAARLIAEAAEKTGLLADYPGIDGIVPISHGTGCGLSDKGEGFDILRRTLWGTAANPNFGAVLLVGLGCEVVQSAQLAADFGLRGRDDFQTFTIQDVGGTRKAVERGLDALRELLPVAAAARRTECPASELRLGLQCGGSDAWSGLTANPALGNAVDRLVALGGTAILSETPEIFGADHLLAARAVHPDVARRLAARLAWWEEYTTLHGAQMNSNPSPGNLAGGLTTILEKSLGAVAKAGTSPLVDVIEYAEPLRRNGLVFMDSPGFDPCSATGQVASGATLIAFTTGRGSAFGFKPSPSIKLSSNTPLYERMTDDIDIDCGGIMTGRTTIEDKGKDILDLLLDVASGTRTKSEELGYGGIEFVPWQIGAVM
ncbi:altronate hydrolase [Hephaestia caeni]|uniref:Altronate hydrolase n=1 Tax=Hephaestia caeni TaxID=645617 RepID=A0A397PIE1_9SPHN|nr:altronate dehydratase family protein [Hephaestia caeni]RIA46927.1 altronate hydrolase [Hephaestia caeni]